MTRLPQLSPLLLFAAALGCGETTTNPLSQLTFDRPVDIAFACHGGLRITGGAAADPSQPVEISAMPTSACDVRSVPLQPVACRPTEMEQVTPLGQENLRDAACNFVSQLEPVSWYGLILQSGPGTVAIARFSTKAATLTGSAGDDVVVLDADPLTPGKNSISVGEEPVAIHTDPAGCHAITANAGSCDLSVLDLNSALDTDRAVRVDRLGVKSASGAPIRSRPAAMVGQPPEQIVGNVCPATPQGRVWVAYPSCHLVAAVDTSTGAIVRGIQFAANGTASIVDGNVTCPDECGGGAVATAGVRPVALDLEVDPTTSSQRLVIGADNSSRITVVELDSGALPDPTKPIVQIQLEDATGGLGVTALALSREIGMGGKGDMIDEEGQGGAFQFVYAIATDGTVRVADVLDEDRECDTQVDPRFSREIQDVRDLSCLPVGTLMTPRRAGARSPGIHLPGDAIPLSVEIFTSAEPIDPNAGRPGESPGTLLGHFALITATNGAAFLVNVDDDNFADVFNGGAPLATPMPHVMAHQLRDLHDDRHLTIDDEDDPADPADNRDCDYGGRFDDFNNAIGGPRAAAQVRTVPAGSVAPEKLTQLPGLRQLKCERANAEGTLRARAISELQYAASTEARDRSFPDLLALPEAETWSLIWEGPLSLNLGANDVDGPSIREGTLRVDALGMHVLDQTKAFCDAGVEPFDILQLRGCDPSVGAADCPSGYTCFVHPESQIQGLGTCMLADEADRLADACRDFMTTLRRYTVKTAASGELLVKERRVELRTTPLDGCVSDQQCQDLADYAARSGSSKHPFEDNTAPDPGTWACVVDPLRAPKGGTGKRCELRCDTTADCLTGTVCQGAVAGQPSSGFCMEGVIPPQSCINASQRFELSVGEAFAVIGSESGFVHPIVADAAGQCVRDPDAHRLSIGRLPLVPRDPLAPATLRMCDPAADPLTGEITPGVFEPNPCLTTIDHVDALPQYMPGTCTVVPNSLPVISDPRQAPAVVFRNRSMNLTLVDPYYPGDRTCIADRQGVVDRQGNPIPGQIPHVVSRMTLTIRQVGGFEPLRVLGSEAPPSFPVKAVRGPTGSVWVLDEGDFLSASPTQSSTRGQVLRFHPNTPGAANVLR